MRRCIGGVWLLAVLLGLGLLATWMANRDLEPIVRDLEEASRQVLAGDWQEAQQHTGKARKNWEKRWTRIAALSSHAPMEEADQWFQRMRVYARAGDAVRYADACAQLAGIIRSISEAQSPNWRNFL